MRIRINMHVRAHIMHACMRDSRIDAPALVAVGCPVLLDASFHKDRFFYGLQRARRSIDKNYSIRHRCAFATALGRGRVA